MVKNTHSEMASFEFRKQVFHDQVRRFALAYGKDDAERTNIRRAFTESPTAIPDQLHKAFMRFIGADDAEQNAKAIQDANDLRLPTTHDLFIRMGRMEEEIRDLRKKNAMLTDMAVQSAQAIDATANAQDDLMFVGTGYNTVRRTSANAVQIYGRYQGPFSAELLGYNSERGGQTGTPDAGDNARSIRLKVRGGYITAGRSTFYWPRNNPDIGYALLSPYTPAGGVGDIIDTWIYLEIPVEPDAGSCSALWAKQMQADGIPTGILDSPNDMTNDFDSAKYYPCFRHTCDVGNPPTGYPLQLARVYNNADEIGEQVQDEDFKQVVRHATFHPDNLPVAVVVIGKITWEITDRGPTIRKYEQLWQNGDIYVPVWRWRHCQADDGFSDVIYPNPAGVSVDCVFGASFCSPVCQVPWDMYDIHKHGGVTAGGDASGIPDAPLMTDCSP